MNSVIVASPPLFGETVPMLHLAADLVRRGHRVTALVGSRFGDRAEATGARFAPLPPGADWDDRQHDLDPRRSSLPPFPDRLNWDMSEMIVGTIDAQFAAVQDLLDEDPDAALLANSLFVGAWPTALGAPGRRPRRWVAVVANPVVLGDDATTAFGPIRGIGGAEAVAAHHAANAEFDAQLAPTTDRANRELDALGATQRISAYFPAIYELPDAVAALTVREFDYPRTTPPAGLVYAGALPTGSASDGRKPDWWGDLLSGRPVVVVTQGTLANSELGRLIEPALVALADREVLVVAALGRPLEQLSVDVPTNARVAEYVPFDELLPLADALVTNGGFGGTQQALASGVPLVMCGDTEDKAMTAAHVSYHGVGIDLGTATPGGTAIAEAVDRVLADPSYTEAARRMQRAYAAVDPYTVVADLLG